MKIQLREFDVLKSTNETAVAMAQEGAPEGTVIVAARQKGGHGRMQRVWSSPLGGLWFTVILRPQIDPQFAAQITLLAGVAVAKAVRRLYDTESVQIKWPNDLLLDGKKSAAFFLSYSLMKWYNRLCYSWYWCKCGTVRCRLPCGSSCNCSFPQCQPA